MTRFAQQTTVPIAKTQVDLKRLLESYGADEVVITESRRLGRGIVQFRFHELQLRVPVRLPSMAEKRFHLTPGGDKRTKAQARKFWEQACRQQWRVLFYLVKAQLVAIEENVFSPEEAFLPWLVLPNGRTVIEDVTPGLQNYLKSGKMPKLLMFSEDPASSTDYAGAREQP